MSDAIIRVEQLSKTFGNFNAVNGVSFDVARGEIFAFLGPERRRQDHDHQDADDAAAPDERPIRIDGLDPVTHPHEVRPASASSSRTRASTAS